ncbi:MAG: Ig-like domain-containing protein [Caldilineaceae bacterium]
MSLRVTISGTATGQSVLDANNVRQYEVKYSCVASDWQLDESKFNCPGNAVQPASRGFNSDPILQSQFPTLTILSSLSNTWTVWQPSNIPSGSLTACDATGKCSTAVLGGGAVAASEAAGSESVTSYQYPVTTAEVAAVPSEQPTAHIVNPTDGSFVGSTGNVEVVVAAEAAKTLKEVTVLLDGEVAATIPFARIDKVTVAQQSIELSLSAGSHTLEARASDWNGSSQPAGEPVHFTVVSKEPTVALGKTNLTLSDTYQAQSGIVLIQGTVDNVANLATVQVKVGDQPYADALVKDGVWGIAYPVSDPENRNLPISVRAIDKAGQITKIGADANADFDSGTLPETSITAQPNDSVNATIGFTGTVGGDVAVAFECRLDEGVFTACTTPVAYQNLSNGAHTFQVHAINGQGTQDPTPAEVKWTVNGGGVEAKIGNAPSNPTSSRSASFTLNGGGAYECSLDGAAFTACTSPVNYTNLTDGTHTASRCGSRATQPARSVGMCRTGTSGKQSGRDHRPECQATRDTQG